MPRLTKTRSAIAVLVAALCSLALAASSATALGDRDCSDFSTQRQAQNFFKQQGGPKYDRHRLDADRDGRACESLP